MNTPAITSTPIIFPSCPARVFTALKSLPDHNCNFKKRQKLSDQTIGEYPGKWCFQLYSVFRDDSIAVILTRSIPKREHGSINSGHLHICNTWSRNDPPKPSEVTVQKVILVTYSIGLTLKENICKSHDTEKKRTSRTNEIAYPCSIIVRASRQEVALGWLELDLRNNWWVGRNYILHASSVNPKSCTCDLHCRSPDDTHSERSRRPKTCKIIETRNLSQENSHGIEKENKKMNY